MVAAGDRIDIVGLRALGRHGVLPEEAERPQPFVVDVSLRLDASAAAASDDLADTVDYGALARAVHEAVTGTRFDLLEALAGHLASLALADERVAAATVRVSKPRAPVEADVAEVAVTVTRTREAEA